METAQPKPPPLPPATIPRRHDLDALRAWAMLGGIALHGCLSYVTFPFWPVYDADSAHMSFDIFFVAVHGFRMPLFFLISGFFTAMLWRKRGLRALILHRAKRILLPLIIFTPIVLPLMMLFISMDGQTGSRPVSQAEEQPADHHWQAVREGDLERLKLLLPEVADLNQGDPEHQILPLHWAALSGHAEIAKALLDAGADIDARIDDQSTPLIHAAFMGRPEVTKLLLDRGADRNLINTHQSTALDAAHADWALVEWVSGELDLVVDKESWQQGLQAVRRILEEAGATRHQAQQTEATGITAAYAALTRRPIFRAADIFGHLWFLWFLILLLIPFAIYATVADSVNWRVPKGLILSPWMLTWLIPLTMIPMWFNGLNEPAFGPDTSSNIIPPPHLLLIYWVYFFVGALYFDCDDQEGRLGRQWSAMLIVAIVILLPAGLHLTFEAPGAVFLAKLCQVAYCWFMILGSIGLFRAVCRTESRLTRYISDSSYWLYVAHLPFIFLMQAVANDWGMNGFAKFAIVCVSVTAALLVVYDLCVRYTWLGTLLNGKRERGKNH